MISINTKEFYEQLLKGEKDFSKIRIRGTRTKRDEEEFPKELQALRRGTAAYTQPRFEGYHFEESTITRLYLPKLTLINSHLQRTRIEQCHLPGGSFALSNMNETVSVGTTYKDFGFGVTEQEQAIYLNCDNTGARFHQANLQQTAFRLGTNMTRTAKGLIKARNIEETLFGKSTIFSEENTEENPIIKEFIKRIQQKKAS